MSRERRFEWVRAVRRYLEVPAPEAGLTKELWLIAVEKLTRSSNPTAGGASEPD